eukprot:sb/3464682/
MTTVHRKTLKSGCLSLLTIHLFWHSRRVRAVVRVWLGFGFGVRLGLSILYQRCRLVYSNRPCGCVAIARALVKRPQGTQIIIAPQFTRPAFYICKRGLEHNKKIYKFTKKTRIPTLSDQHALPLPGTPLYQPPHTLHQLAVFSHPLLWHESTMCPTCILALLLVGVTSRSDVLETSTPLFKQSPTTQSLGAITSPRPLPVGVTASPTHYSFPFDWSSTGTVPPLSPKSCKIVAIFGYLKRFCGHNLYKGKPYEENLDHIPDRFTSSRQLDLIRGPWPEFIIQCARSPQYFVWKNSFYSTGEGFFIGIRFSEMCPDDPGVYQACGIALEIGTYKFVENSLALCGAQLCVDEGDESKQRSGDGYALCPVEETSEACDQKCSTFECEDESECNGARLVSRSVGYEVTPIISLGRSRGGVISLPTHSAKVCCTSLRSNVSMILQQYSPW